MVLSFSRDPVLSDRKPVLHLDATEDALHLGIVSRPVEDVGEPYPRPQKQAGPRGVGEHRILVLLENHTFQRIAVAGQGP